MSPQRYNILLEKANKSAFSLVIRQKKCGNLLIIRQKKCGVIAIIHQKKCKLTQNYSTNKSFDSDISVRIEVKANHQTSRSGRYGCPISRQPRSFPSDHR